MRKAVTDEQIIRQCIQRCARTKYASGGWQAQRACCDKLTRGDDGSSALIAAQCADAARRIGEWLRSA